MLFDPLSFLLGSLLLLPAIAIAIPVHELGHGVAAHAMGDPSPRNRGYFRASPIHLFSVYGLVAVFLANVGWGTPIPVNEYRLRGVLRKLVWVLGGPAANLVAAAILGTGYRLLEDRGFFASLTPLQPPLNYLVDILYAAFFLNLAIFAFQLLPVPGLDGWRVIEALFRNRNPRFFFDVTSRQQTIWIVCLIVVLVAPILLHVDILGAVVAILFQPLSRLITGQCGGYTTLHPCLGAALAGV
ncbi:MAG TPA: site-2 protease family protein [Candidatus Dormibacteraeota bacterium]|nr:site-2 protease family protein [Candidatus Dormibacteraeota bacterium]